MRNAVLVSAVRSPVGKRGGVFKTVQRMDLLKPCILEAIKSVIRTARQGIFGGSLLAEQESNDFCINSKDIGEGLAALREKRQPDLKNE